MAEKNNAKCSICDKDYYLCLSCKDTLSLHPWRIHTCSAPHYQIYQIIRGYNTKVYTKDEARTKLKNVNLDDLNSFRPHIKKIIKDILKEEKPAVKTIEKVESVDEIIQMEVAEVKEKVVEKPVYSRKRNYKVDAE